MIDYINDALSNQFRSNYSNANKNSRLSESAYILKHTMRDSVHEPTLTTITEKQYPEIKSWNRPSTGWIYSKPVSLEFNKKIKVDGETYQFKGLETHTDAGHYLYFKDKNEHLIRVPTKNNQELLKKIYKAAAKPKKMNTFKR